MNAAHAKYPNANYFVVLGGIAPSYAEHERHNFRALNDFIRNSCKDLCVAIPAPDPFELSHNEMLTPETRKALYSVIDSFLR